MFSENQVHGVSPKVFAEIHFCKSQMEISENQVPTSKIARCVPRRFFSRESSPQISNCKVSPLRFFRASSPHISNRNGCPLKRILENQGIKSQISIRFFRESSPQISSRQRCFLKMFQGIKTPNLKSQGGPPKIFQRIKSPNLKAQFVP